MILLLAGFLAAGATDSGNLNGDRACKEKNSIWEHHSSQGKRSK